MNRPIINLDEVVLEPRTFALSTSTPPAERFESRMGMVASRIGAQKLGYNITAVPPGKRAFPAHNHRVNEELFLILEGEGQVRIGSEVYPLRRGDLIACPPGGEEAAHQIINTGTVELRYLAVSTKITPEIVDYPDSKKFGVLADFGPGPDGKPRGFRFVGRREQNVDYWDGE